MPIDPEVPVRIIGNTEGKAPPVPAVEIHPQPTVTSPDNDHRQLGVSTARDMEAIGLIPTTPEDVMTNSPEKIPLENTPSIQEVGGEVLSEMAEVAGNIWEDKIIYPVFGSSAKATKISFGEGSKAEAILEGRLKKEKAADLMEPDDEKMAA